MATHPHPQFGNLIKEMKRGIIGAILFVVVGLFMIYVAIHFLWAGKLGTSIIPSIIGVAATLIGINGFFKNSDQTYIYERGIVTKTNNKVNQWELGDIKEVWYIVQKKPLNLSTHSLRLTMPDGKSLNILGNSTKGKNDNNLDIILSIMNAICTALADRYQKTIDSGGSVVWIDGVTFTRDGLSIGKNKVPWEDLDYGEIDDRSGQACIYRKGATDPIVKNYCFCFSKNFYPGWELLKRYLPSGRPS
jgi:hypothetical protein